MLWLLCAAAAGAALHSNAYTSTPPAVRNGRFPIAAETATIRHAQELAVSPARLLSPTPLRSAKWVDTAPSPGLRSYAVQSLSASGIRSNLVISDPLTIPAL